LVRWALLYIGSPAAKKPIFAALPIGRLSTRTTFKSGVPAGGFNDMLQQVGLPPAELARPCLRGADAL
jgi:hypothetical protein